MFLSLPDTPSATRAGRPQGDGLSVLVFADPAATVLWTVGMQERALELPGRRSS
jgi:hypothetical protein